LWKYEILEINTLTYKDNIDII